MAGEDGRIPDTVRLCSHHEATIHALAKLDHVDDRDSDRVAEQISGQCCNQGRDLR
jgi:hypothetical protein